MKVPYVRRNLVPDTWTADGEGALLALGPCPHDNSCVGCRGTVTISTGWNESDPSKTYFCHLSSGHGKQLTPTSFAVVIFEEK